MNSQEATLKRIEKLEKENAELKKQVSEKPKDLNKEGYDLIPIEEALKEVLQSVRAIRR